MSSSDNNRLEQHDTEFGKSLLTARKARKLSIEAVAEQLKVPLQIIEAIESSDLEKLPPPTFTRGYIHAYARFVETSDVDVLASYARAIPPRPVLKPSARVPNEANSQSPLIKFITIILLVLGLLAVLYGGYQYYNKKAGSLQASMQQKTQQMDREVSSLGQLTLKPLPTESASVNAVAEKQPVKFDAGSQHLALQKPATTQTGAAIMAPGSKHQSRTAQVPSTSPSPDIAAQPAIAVQGTDSISLLAKKGAWLEIRDNTGKRLHYNMIPAGKWVHYTGEAPFVVSMGNARSTQVKVNGVNADISHYTRSNNIAHFQVSTTKRNGKVVITLQPANAN